MAISCHNAKRRSTAYVDGRLRSDERTGVAAHLTECEECTSYFEQLTVIRSALKGLSAPPIPGRLQTSLKVIASRERANVLEWKGSRFRAVWERWKFHASELMRPLALPATGGLISALLLFGTFVLTMGTTTRIASYEIPLSAITDDEPNLLPVDLRSNLIVLNMTLDSSGRIGDYAISDPAKKFTAGLQSHLGSITLPSMPNVFAVAQPISGDIQIRFIPLAFRQ
ncbi:MAG: zf-HC2 domain-containing protein [Bryobacteraceae bacterium]